MDEKTVCLKCGSYRVYVNEIKLHPETQEPISVGLFVFLYLTSIPSIFLGILLAVRETEWPYGVALTVLAIVAFFAAIILHRTWHKAEATTYHTCRDCGYARKDSDPLPAIEADAGVFLETLSEKA